MPLLETDAFASQLDALLEGLFNVVMEGRKVSSHFNIDDTQFIEARHKEA